eukprot:394097-Pleurochrysis_carterae.AAC.1
MRLSVWFDSALRIRRYNVQESSDQDCSSMTTAQPPESADLAATPALGSLDMHICRSERLRDQMSKNRAHCGSPVSGIYFLLSFNLNGLKRASVSVSQRPGRGAARWRLLQAALGAAQLGQASGR